MMLHCATFKPPMSENDADEKENNDKYVSRYYRSLNQASRDSSSEDKILQRLAAIEKRTLGSSAESNGLAYALINNDPPIDSTASLVKTRRASNETGNTAPSSGWDARKVSSMSSPMVEKNNDGPASNTDEFPPVYQSRYYASINAKANAQKSKTRTEESLYDLESHDSYSRGAYQSSLTVIQEESLPPKKKKTRRRRRPKSKGRPHSQSQGRPPLPHKEVSRDESFGRPPLPPPKPAETNEAAAVVAADGPAFIEAPFISVEPMEEHDDDLSEISCVSKHFIDVLPNMVWKDSDTISTLPSSTGSSKADAIEVPTLLDTDQNWENMGFSSCGVDVCLLQEPIQDLSLPATRDLEEDEPPCLFILQVFRTLFSK